MTVTTAQTTRIAPEDIARARARQAELRAETTAVQDRLRVLKTEAEAAAWPETSAEYRAYQTERVGAVRRLEILKQELRDLKTWLDRHSPLPARTISPDLARDMLDMVSRISRDGRVPLTDAERATLLSFRQLTARPE